MADNSGFIYCGEMPRYCAAPFCNNSSLNGDPSLHLFKFPLKNKTLLDDWLANIPRNQFQPNENSYLCSEHFEAYDIIHTFGRTTLKENAVPSIFKWNIMPVCYVPGCKSGYVINGKLDYDRHFFSPPKNQDKLEIWSKAIKRTDKQLDHNCKVCDLHFEDYFIEKYYTLLSNGEIKKHEPGKWTLHPDAVPTIFSDDPERISSMARKRTIKRPYPLYSTDELSMEDSFDEYNAMTDSIKREASALRELLEYRLAAAKSKDVDASLMKLEFGNKRIEWVYRGSGRHSSYPDKSGQKEKIHPRKKICRIPINRKNYPNIKCTSGIDQSIFSSGSDDDSRKIPPKQTKVPFQVPEDFNRPQRAKKHTGGGPLKNNQNRKKHTVIPKARKKFQKQKTVPYPLITAENYRQLAKKQTSGKLNKTIPNDVVKVYVTSNSKNVALKEKTESKQLSKLPHLPQVARKHTGGTTITKVTEKTGLAKKSTTLGLLEKIKTNGANNMMHSGDKDEVKITPNNIIQNNKPVHKCGRSCSRIKDDDPIKFRGKNPLQIPRLCGWKRHVEKKVVIYSAPCGRIFRAIDEISRYLWTVKSKLTIDLFCFDTEIYMANEYTPKQIFAYIPDVTFGKENVPVSCVNSVNDEYPPDIGYANIRYPGKGVNLNIDPEFLCGCDCKDNCQNSRRCQCQQLTVNATVALPSGKISNAGYKYRRLVEPLITGIYECNSKCKCGPSCMNRVAQNGLQVRLQLFHTETKGWGIRCLDDIPQGMFICTYAGELLTEQGANEDGRQLQDDYLAELDHIEVVEKLKEGYESDVVEPEDGAEVVNEHTDVKNIVEKLAGVEDCKIKSEVSSLDMKTENEVLAISSIKIEVQDKTDLSTTHSHPISIAATEEFLIVHSSEPNQVFSLAVVETGIQNTSENTTNNQQSMQEPISNVAIACSPRSISDCSYNNNNFVPSVKVETSLHDISAVSSLMHLENNNQSNNENFSNVESLSPGLRASSVSVENVHEEMPEDSSSIVHLLNSTQSVSPLVAENTSLSTSETSFIAECLDSSQTSPIFVENDTHGNTKQSSFLDVKPLSQDSVSTLANAEIDSQDITDSSLNVQLSDQALSPSSVQTIVESTLQERTVNSISVSQLDQVQIPLLTTVQSCPYSSNLESSDVQSFNQSEVNTIVAENCLHNTSTDSSNVQALSQEQTLLMHIDNSVPITTEHPLTVKTCSPPVAVLPMLTESTVNDTTESSFNNHQLTLDETSIIKEENPCCAIEESFGVQTSSHDSTLLLTDHIASNSQCATESSVSTHLPNLALTSPVSVERSLHDITENSQNIYQMNLTQNVPLANAEIPLCDITEGSSNIQTFTPSISASSLVEHSHHSLITDPSVIVTVLNQNPTTLALVECDSQVTTKNCLSDQSISPSLIPLSMLVESALQDENEHSDIQPSNLAQISSIVPVENSLCDTTNLTSFKVENISSCAITSVNSENILPGMTQSSISVESSREDLISSLTCVENTFQETDSSLSFEHSCSAEIVPIHVKNELPSTEEPSVNVQSISSDTVPLQLHIENNIQDAVEDSSNVQQPHIVVTQTQQSSGENNQGVNPEDNSAVCLPVSKAKISKAKKSTVTFTPRFSKRIKRNTVSETTCQHCSCNSTNNSKGRKKSKGHSHFLSVRKYFNEQYCYLMNAEKCGNIGRYLNHSCNPNCFVQNVFVDTHDLRFPWVAFFAMRHVSAGSELTWDYNYSVGSVPGKILYCHCGSENCRGRLI